MVCLSLQLESALIKSQKQEQQNQEQLSNLRKKLHASMAGRQDTVSPCPKLVTVKLASSVGSVDNHDEVNMRTNLPRQRSWY